MMDTQSNQAVDLGVIFSGVKPEVLLAAIAKFCQHWHICELALFGSVLRPDFRPDSDIDVLVTFETGSQPTLADRATMGEELAGLLNRRVDLVYRRVIERDPNYLLRRSILDSAKVIYAA